MSTDFKGFIAKLTEKNSEPGAKRAWTLRSIKLEKADGSEYEQWISLGFDDLGVKEGDYVKLQATEDKGRFKLVEGSLKKSSNPPARVKKVAPAGGGSRPNYSGNGRSGGGTKFDGTGIQNRTNPEDAKRMTFNAARSAAIELAAVLLLNKGLPMSKADTKAGEAKRFDEITAVVDKLTVKFFNDGMTLRLLETVADTVTDKKADGQLPDKEENEDGRDNDGSAAAESTDTGAAGTDAEFPDDEGFDD